MEISGCHMLEQNHVMFGMIKDGNMKFLDEHLGAIGTEM